VWSIRRRIRSIRRLTYHISNVADLATGVVGGGTTVRGRRPAWPAGRPSEHLRVTDGGGGGSWGNHGFRYVRERFEDCGGEVSAVARQGKGRSTRTRRQSSRRAPRWLFPVVVLGIMAFLYARPIASYMDTRDQLAERRAEVASLRAERARVTARLERVTSLDELARAARGIGYVRPDEHLFIVKGTAAWSRRHAADESGRDHG
jgi:hypothetical protein